MTDDPPEGPLLSGSTRRSVRIANLHGHDVDIMPVLRAPARRCGYTQCGNELDYDGKGRPPEYCPPAVRTWPGGKTCKQMAAAERDAIRVAGLDAQLDAYDTSTGRLIAAVEPLHARLGDLLADLAGVRNGALVRVGEAEREMTEAIARAERADHAARHAQQSEAAAHRMAARAEAEAAQARQQLHEARQDADARIAAALDRLTVVEREHGQALARTHAAEAARHDEAQRRKAAEQRAAALDVQLQRVRDQIEKVRAGQDAVRARTEAAEQVALQVRTELVQATARAERAEALAADRTAELDEVRNQLTRERDAAETRAAAAAEALDEARTKREQLRRQVAAAEAAARAATERADRAETRHDELVDTLSTLAHRGASPEGDPA